MEFPVFSVVRFGNLPLANNSTYRLHDPTDEIGANAACYELEFYYAESSGGLTIEGTQYPVRPGFFTCCKPGQFRKMTLPYKCYYLNITTGDSALQESLNKLPTYGSMEQSEQILTLCKTMYKERQRDALYGKLLIESCVCAIMSILFRSTYSFTNVADCKVYRHQAALLAANEYLRNHLQDDVDLKQLAQDSGLHPTYFHKLFTAAFHKTPAQQLMTHRLHAAISMLVSEELPISEISARCGFSTPNYFCHKFRDQVGMTPNQYRKSSRNRDKNKDTL